MSRINYPERFTEETELFKNLKAKHVADGAASVLIPYLTAENIDLTADETAMTNAIASHQTAKQATKDAEKFSNERDRLHKQVFTDHKRCVQFLKKLYISNVHNLGDWSVTVDNESKIVYPADFIQMNNAIGTFIAKHLSFAVGTSPLKAFLAINAIDLTVNLATNGSARQAHTSFTKAALISEQQHERRDLLFDPVMEHVRGCGGFLVQLYDTQPKKAGDWGYAIDDSPRDAVMRQGSVNPGALKVLRNVSIGSIMTNKGTVSLKIHKGKIPGTTPIILDPNQKFTIIRNYGTLTLQNESTADNGEYQAEFLK